MTQHPKVGVIVLNWNGHQDTLECLASLKGLDYPNYTVYLADNGSTDHSVEILSKEIPKRFPDVHFHVFDKMYGFAGGNNRLVDIAMKDSCDVLFLLNNDTTIAKDCLKEFEKAAKKLPKRSALGAKIPYYSEPDRIWHAGAIWNEKKFEYHKLHKDKPLSECQEQQEVDFIVGCVMWIPAFLVQELGLFDERFFLNYEETDWCMRAKRAGVQLYTIPTALVWHKVSRTFVSKPHNLYFLSRNRLLWMEKHFSFVQRMRYRFQNLTFRKLYRAVRFSLRILATPIYFLGGKKARQHWVIKIANPLAELLGKIDFYRRRFGNCPHFILWLSKKAAHKPR